MKALPCAHPVLSCQQAATFEASVLADESAEWSAMQKAGIGIAKAVCLDYQELQPLPQGLNVLALIGKGNNGGDALIACGQLLADFPRARVTLIFAVDPASLKPLAARAYQQLKGRVSAHQVDAGSDEATIWELLKSASGGRAYDICIDGLLGMSFQPPVREPLRALIEAVNQYDQIHLRAAVDLPSGKGDASDELSFQADFTYATGITKQVLFDGIAGCGRVRSIDLGFFTTPEGAEVDATEMVLNDSVLDPLRKLRPAAVDKRTFGHIFIVGGSAFMPGALLMAVQAAVRSGVGLVTAFAPASVAATLAAQVPEAIWVPWPESSNGTLSPRAMPLLFDRIDQATAVLIGPGMGKDRNTEKVVQEIVQKVALPVILDADALRTRALELSLKRKPEMGAVILTPHMGEFMRMAKLGQPDYSNQTLINFCKSYRVMTVLKAAHTRLCDGETVWYNICGGPVLSRGGSGDVLAGLIGGMVAQDNASAQTSVARGMVLHGQAAQHLARELGQVMVHTTQLLEYLPKVLRGDS
ncbi:MULTISPECIES: NAD(P)H-hydrate dehydratase [unclassified Lentimonas]|uniref:NAD(P)H-hydrate dehydratase n=1 Tax=unclassified Lentimonas TaxID=2630993 RepID=UPI00132524D9|nr:MULTISPECIES: NAD(P)H-hydrate dehydratase [unclassified Lentimonas]CAA6676724.1 NAD(P)HX epimerase / NAD(P)HX dehydratase [Lentimonas sp. CC4]CAA6684611.1 NAD(P)HX epimerase / NAD(P)HX dehydratase [Lentimonas sp. CC6]CAA7075247.1 NAD(P)HX epimerase / NAD(P)HX dehydratase [Lentimonas sp. CC4]CAA7170632.1 NAD(P)HX epimerase / NAD(P)HX dehydratase [Lentimonas sp. CC21]CAA7182345.1 NAD(P)HX epimerase / NAD(P)HX dehydratase [Lentimonas sp. CC8]